MELNKALEKSDKYIEELQKDADNYRGKDRNQSSAHKDYLASQEPYSKVNGKSGKRVTFELPHDKNVTTSFDLEMPSPMKQNSSISVSSPVKGVLKKSPNDSLNLSKPSSIEDNRSYKSFSKDDSDIYVPKTKSYERTDDNLWKRSSNGHDESLNDSFALENPRKSYRTDKGFVTHNRSRGTG
ncbi:OBI1 [Mytilus edulis]|uniref:OBI1 n=1 Tax=Mytilus edulis TaxID=6550 RepID=A0A8S3U5Y5_MYTED|nr:OBI1 [Mytilus edulis]